MTNNATTSKNWGRPDPVDAESEWELFLNSKKHAMNRMKAGRVDALRRLGNEKNGGRSLVSEVSDDREARGSFHKENYSHSAKSEVRDAPESNYENPALDSTSRSELDMRKLIEIFTVIKKRRWDDLVELLQMYPRSASIPCPKNIQSTAKGNLMLHEACRNDPPLRVISALVDEYADAVKAKGGKGYLPLHYACATDASSDVVRKLLDTFPASIRMRDTNDLMIPLHFACKWGASPAIIELLVSAYPEGKQVRDIFAKTPVDYANELSGQERVAIIKMLERSYHSRSDRSFARSVTVSDASLSDAVSVASKQIHRELRTTKTKLEKATSELNERERKFSLQYGAEKSKAAELEKQKEILEQEFAQARVNQDEQKEKIQLLQDEVKTLKSLQDIHNQKKIMLMEKIEELEREKANIDSDGDHESSAKIKRELTATMVEQEIKYKAMLAGEQRKIENLEKKAKEAELTHRHYTMALLQEHEKEVTRFEELTSRFKILEGQLRQEIENERTKRLSVQNSSQGPSQRALESEKEKVAFLEAHITKVNDLLEAEQKRFIELEAILKETLAIENEQREEIEAEFREKESEYQSRIEIEGQKRSQLENAYTDIAEKLKEEIEKTSGLQAYEMELKKELKMDQEKIAELQRMQGNSEKALANEKKRVEEMAKTEANSRLLLKSEELKVKELESKLDEMHRLLNAERECVKALRLELEGLEALYKKELKKVREAEEAESSARSELRTLNAKVANLEEEESAIKTKISEVQASKEEYQKLKSKLESDRDQVNRLAETKEDVRELLDAEKEKVKSLENQVDDENENEDIDSQDMSQASTIEERLMEQQAIIDHHKYRVNALEEKHNTLTKEIETERESTRTLARTIEEREEELDEEREKFEVLLKEHGEIQVQLVQERSKVKGAASKATKFGERLSLEKDSVEQMQQMVDQAKIDFESKIEEVSTLEKEEADNRQALDASLKELNISNEEVSTLSEALSIEKRRVAEMVAALKEVQNLVQDEKNRVIEYKRLLEAQKHLTLADQAKIRQLERVIEDQLENLGLGKAENIKLEIDLAETKSLLDAETKKVMELLEQGHSFDDSRATALFETEQNKVKALEHSCEQLMSLLDFEKKHVLSLEEKQEELQEQAESSTEELAAIKKALGESQMKVLKHAHELEGFEDMKKEVIRLTLESRQRDIMIASMLYAIGNAKAIKAKTPIQNAEKHLNELETRVVGIDLAGYDEAVVKDRESLQLVAYNSSLRNRTIRNVILPLVVAGGLVEYHHHDPTVLRELASTAVQMSGDLRTNLGEYSHTLGDLSRSVGANFAANMGQLAAAIDSAALRETVASVSGMGRMNIRKV
mmetsp:Transcript_6086/g.15061  ORF Transcript_6086/g.15061 Transcript_6086/m.15061 type:complete len:1352 (-) Transcript_6086:150-4205(-)|eukprot:CAMPEP_0197183646 /NCGR_PEP_ID=MMETSP1423-20130617/7932_1 /TAXON_ID=476441 /ORGANISM="Pseudo-nitzschia heimii, Strain UNC1101" /LENGTH=1351 /DNA_ID=CAMNT_0042634247 /DNA_START=37 /DNA_END=4092 /DNA_ORIENTATION=-